MSRSILFAALVGVTLTSTSAFAEEPKVDVATRVVLASNKGQQIEPPGLQKMKEEFARNGINFSSWRQLSASKVSLEQGKPAQVALPDGRNAQLRLQKMEEGAATVRVTIPKLLDTDYKLGRSGSVYIRSGDYQDGVLILVLSPPGGEQSRVVPQAMPGTFVPAAAVVR